ncbi:hypothetical protein VIBRN418_00330 [Vibrio sp. N418]|uniref:DUF262 domain-containing protein n=1 Tax=Vibrio sp. (strain N418) TaxID=701176 RepID=UPI00021BDEF1|nr:DUF262 domain-containing protein [Vibrio sp. N418]EGU35389.1 hypothetical protein VIBRN418_00330 [Vibrio sp. N418]
MRIQTSDPDIYSIYNRIKRGLIDLQPDFQRGEVWKTLKKQRLIDSILRGWHIPPVHLISDPAADRLEVLDGQQRLVSIRDFLNNEFPIHGFLEPLDDEISSLDGIYWDDLKDVYKDKIELFTIRFLTISDYKVGEPGELFHRLNHPTNLTPAEQRNAFFGESRQQVKNLAEKMVFLGYCRETIGFTNSRMAYDDVVAKILITMDQGTLAKKITSSTITDKYRSNLGFSSEHVTKLELALEIFIHAIMSGSGKVKLNKASFHSWVIFICFLIDNDISSGDLSDFITDFEENRTSNNHDFITLSKFRVTSEGLYQAQKIFSDRSASRVADTSSVILRDIVLVSFYYVYHGFISKENNVMALLDSVSHYLNRGKITEEALLSLSKKHGWREL